MNIIEFENILKKAWSKETSSVPDQWSKFNPALGQCAVTALAVNDYFGGDIVRAKVVLANNEEISHYFNKIGEEEVDLSRLQFPLGTTIPNGVTKQKEFASTREYILSFESTNNRYKILLKRVLKEVDFMKD